MRRAHWWDEEHKGEREARREGEDWCLSVWWRKMVESSVEEERREMIRASMRAARLLVVG